MCIRDRDIEEIERNKNPDVSEEEIERRYKEHIWIYHQFQKESKKAEQIIRKYGKDKEEIKEKLKIHFNQCEKCRQVYLKKLDKIAEAHMEIAERVLGKSEKSYFALIKEWDFLKYLQH